MTAHQESSMLAAHESSIISQSAVPVQSKLDLSQDEGLDCLDSSLPVTSSLDQSDTQQNLSTLHSLWGDGRERFLRCAPSPLAPTVPPEQCLSITNLSEEASSLVQGQSANNSAELLSFGDDCWALRHNPSSPQPSCSLEIVSLTANSADKTDAVPHARKTTSESLSEGAKALIIPKDPMEIDLSALFQVRDGLGSEPLLVQPPLLPDVSQILRSLIPAGDAGRALSHCCTSDFKTFRKNICISPYSVSNTQDVVLDPLESPHLAPTNQASKMQTRETAKCSAMAIPTRQLPTAKSAAIRHDTAALSEIHASSLASDSSYLNLQDFSSPGAILESQKPANVAKQTLNEEENKTVLEMTGCRKKHALLLAPYLPRLESNARALTNPLSERLGADPRRQQSAPAVLRDAINRPADGLSQNLPKTSVTITDSQASSSASLSGCWDGYVIMIGLAAEEQEWTSVENSVLCTCHEFVGEHPSYNL